jgi:hypothetical protein
MKVFKNALCIIALGLVAGCSGGGGGGGGNGGSAPDSIQNRTINVVVSGGASPFTSSGSYVFTPAGDGHSGTYRLDGNGVQSNIGTYTWTKTGANTAKLVETEQSGTIVQNTLTFSGANSGTIHSSSSNRGGFQDGSFTLN